jgi:hypothetical protein
MWGSWWLDLMLGVAAGLVLAWLALLVALIIARPRGGLLREALRLLPDLLRLLPRLAADRSLRAACGPDSRCCWPTWRSRSTWCPLHPGAR